ncbi:mycofactocin-coupled SDR family oxidoreductase [Rhodococcus qingshengii]|uniref:mycofactocin-coupled SDR family oxidoreductase n=1 Tax=Rhodococcus qingshengii TaxID=334542 RepID=UPI001BE6D6B8|nr:mycofactocin-coupled SDR family oxidoreductase [Rhodococcus qingshengii]MBT2273897.1 mycofactocin-coupled SDR family oxidoreductase [Rhodococcus qingshengii]
MTGRVEGKVAFITGAARGQGRSHALRLAEEGADIIAIDLCGSVPTIEYPLGTEDDLAETAALVEKLDRRVVTAQADVRDFESLKTALDRGVAELGHVDIVCANAGVLSMGAAHEQSEEQWQQMIDVNLTGVWHTAKAAIPHMIEQGTGGSLILTSSLMGLKGASWTIGYVAAKFGVVGIGRALAHELAPYKIRSNVLHPTNIQTPMLDNEHVLTSFRQDLESPTFSDMNDTLSAMNIWPMPTVEVSDISNAVLWLASDEARYVTGISLPVDLGASAK